MRDNFEKEVKNRRTVCAVLHSSCPTEIYQNFDVFKAHPEEIAKNVELLPPLIWPAGCGPLATRACYANSTNPYFVRRLDDTAKCQIDPNDYG